MTRRELLASAAAVATLRADSKSMVSHLSAINDEIGMTREETFAFAKQYGLQWLEMRSAQTPGKSRYCETLNAAECRELKKQLSGNGIEVSVLDSSLMKCAFPGTVAVDREDFYTKYFADLGLTDETLFHDRLDMLKKTLDVAHELGTRNIRFFAFWRVKDPAPILPRIAEVLAGMADLAKKSACRLLIENEGSTNVATSDETVEMMRLVPNEALGINWDPQNGIALEPVPFPGGYAKLPKNRIGNVHVKAEGLLGPKHPLDWGAIMKAMLADGYSGKFSLETHRGHSPDNVKASHECMRKMINIFNA
jgi:sugar phosphate isomerase/epimerase